MPKPKMSPLKSTRMKREGTGPKSSEEGAPTLAEVLNGLSDFAQSVGEGEVALAQLDEVLKTVAAGFHECVAREGGKDGDNKRCGAANVG